MIPRITYAMRSAEVTEAGFQVRLIAVRLNCAIALAH